MARKAPQRPVTLSSKPLRRTLSHRAEVSAFSNAFDVLDALGASFDALVTLYQTPDPTRTIEAAAVKYRDQHKRAVERATEGTRRALDGLNNELFRRREAAIVKAGLRQPLTDAAASEIRSALRAMPMADRERAIRNAVANGDAALLQSVMDAPSKLLVGEHNVPVGELVEVMIDNADPDYRSFADDVEAVESLVGGGFVQFDKLTGGMRDIEAENRAEAQQAALQAADNVLKS